MSEYTPGSLWVVKAESWSPEPVTAVRYERGWYWLDDSDYFINDGINTPAERPVEVMRPLVVIDPENREQVERLAEAIPDCGDPTNHCDPQQCLSLSCWIDRVQTALREFAEPTPPKPDEPTGLGAVVEDADGVRWLRGHGDPGFYVWTSPGRDALPRTFARIDAVTILSEGVTQ